MRLISAAFRPVDKLSRLQTSKNAKKFNRLADIKDKNPYISSGTKKGLDFFLILCKIQSTFGAMAEWLKAAVLKTVELRGSEGSNPSCSDLERCESGRIGLPAKELFPKRVPGVRIPLFP